MHRLSCLTRGGSTSQGKPRVYFCCHPDDCSLYINRISQQILYFQNCAIWYDDQSIDTLEDSDMEMVLSQMQLFIVPVTGRLLLTENDAMDVEIPFAIDHHIPILPLIQENNLEHIYKKRFGNLQYLNEEDIDVTQISYEEKLDRFLKSILLGDELSSRIRHAFDGYIFLSYRKKDRWEAQKLMRNIHKNEFCRDIAIWYDEFLSPGENFEQTIGDALRKSNLFVMAVTPNLLEIPNYVMEQEYPAAKKEGKQVLAVEMKETDRRELERYYGSEINCVSVNNENRLTQLLKTMLKNVTTGEKKGAEHEYLIGLAYLGGIDVEVDHHKAVKLIEGAAKQGLVEAIEKLIMMYKTGTGVKRDYQKAIKWQEKLIEKCEEEWNRRQTTENFDLFVEALWQQGNNFEEIEDLENWKETWKERILPFCKQINRQYHFVSSYRYILICYECLVDINIKKKDFELAKRYCQQALQMVDQLAKLSINIEDREFLSTIYERFAEISIEQGDLEIAEQCLANAVIIDQQLLKDNPTPERLQTISISTEMLADFYLLKGNLVKAKEIYYLTLKVRKKISEVLPTINSYKGLAVSNERLGEINIMEENLETANKYYQQCFQIRQKIVNKAPTIQNLRDLAISYNELGDISKLQGDLRAAKKNYQNSLIIINQQIKQSPSIENFRILSVIKVRLGDVIKLQGELGEAKNHYKQSLEICENLTKKSPIIDNQFDLSICYERLGDISKAQGNLVKAKEYYYRVFEIRKKLAKQSKSFKILRSLAISYIELGDISKDQGDLEIAKAYYFQALKICKQLAKESPTVEIRRDLSISYSKIGDIYWKQGDLETAKRYYQHGLIINNSLKN